MECFLMKSVSLSTKEHFAVAFERLNHYSQFKKITFNIRTFVAKSLTMFSHSKPFYDSIFQFLAGMTLNTFDLRNKKPRIKCAN